MSAPVDATLPASPAAPVPAAPAESVSDRADRILRDGPRPEDYLAVPAEVRAFVDSEIRRLLAESGFVVDPATEQWMLANHTLQHYYFGQVVVTLRTPDGVVALAAGGDGVSEYLRRPGHKPFPGVCMENP